MARGTISPVSTSTDGSKARPPAFSRMLALCWPRRRKAKRATWLGVHAGRRHGNHFPLRPPERRELPAENATGVDADGVVDPSRIRNRRVSVNDNRIAAIVHRPVVANHEASLVRLAVGITVNAELANAL